MLIDSKLGYGVKMIVRTVKIIKFFEGCEDHWQFSAIMPAVCMQRVELENDLSNKVYPFTSQSNPSHSSLIVITH